MRPGLRLQKVNYWMSDDSLLRWVRIAVERNGFDDRLRECDPPYGSCKSFSFISAS
jgi:hypothetical protein